MTFWLHGVRCCLCGDSIAAHGRVSGHPGTTQATLTADNHPRFEKDFSDVEEPGVVNSARRE
jgi:hypothetical protein